MEAHRFNGVRIDLDSLSPQERDNLIAYTTQRRDAAIGELAILQPQPEQVQAVAPLFEKHELPYYGE